MAKQSNPDQTALFTEPLSSKAAKRRRRPLILARLLEKQAETQALRGAAQDNARSILNRWADLEDSGHLNKKETSLNADFLFAIFGDALGYQTATKSPENYHLEREYHVSGIGTADAALGFFGTNKTPQVRAVVELKDVGTNLDVDRSNGRTAVQQCWDYLNALPDCPWGIVSNFSEIRLYHRDQTPLRFEVFTLQELRDLHRFRQFYCLFERRGLIDRTILAPPRAVALLEETNNRQREVGDVLYRDYSDHRLRLIRHLHDEKSYSLEDSISSAQKLLDRVIFVAFCEDRELLPKGLLRKAHEDVPPFAKVTNPRWQNYRDLFRAIDHGHPAIDLDTGYNGGLFREDPLVDDMELDDKWTNFFRHVGEYDFRDEVNVDVLGHLFERSVTELEKLRQGDLYGEAFSDPDAPTMPQSAKRKRFGIYYTPQDFTRFIVRQTVEAVIAERFDAIADRRGLNRNHLSEDDPSDKVEAYWRDCIDALRAIKVCDPACGSGAFLIQAYEVLESYYTEVLDHLAELNPEAAAELAGRVPAMILNDNLHGVDLSPEAVEITQLSLWIRSAERGKTLADLSQNIVCGNSLISDPDVHPLALDWPDAFSAAFDRNEAGFDCVIGNPPWERMKLQEREFFSLSAPNIAGASNAAQRRKLIDALRADNPDLYARYEQAKDETDQTLAAVRQSGDYPLTGKGDINTYAVFAELARKIVSPHGRVGLLVPSGIASDNTTRKFFHALTESRSLIALYDFENRRKIFPDVDGRFKFSVLVFGGEATEHDSADFVFFAHRMEDLTDPTRHIALSDEDIALLNPNTRTCPIFRGRRDAELTKAIYQRVPVLVNKPRKTGGNPWGVRFVRMFDQTNDAELFCSATDMIKKRYKLEGNRWIRGSKTYLPAYEAKMVQMYDHRAASVVLEEKNWMRQGQTQATSLTQHQNPEFVPMPRYWIAGDAVDEAIGEYKRPAYLCFKDVTSPTNQRTMIAAFTPHAGFLNSAPLILTDSDIEERQAACLLANLNSFVFDFTARQKVGNVHLNFYIVEQLPAFGPERYDDICPWDSKVKLKDWISERVLKLTCTADDMRPFASAAGFSEGVHKWKPHERAELMAELDAGFFVLYGIHRADVEYILSTFQGVGKAHEMLPGSPTTRDLIMTAYDELAPNLYVSG